MVLGGGSLEVGVRHHVVGGSAMCWLRSRDVQRLLPWGEDAPGARGKEPWAHNVMATGSSRWCEAASHSRQQQLPSLFGFPCRRHNANQRAGDTSACLLGAAGNCVTSQGGNQAQPVTGQSCSTSAALQPFCRVF